MFKTAFPQFFIYIFSIISPLYLSSATYTTISSGYWTNNNIWQNGIAPSLTTSDTIIIKNFIEFNSEIVLNGPAYLRVDSSGALCGHDTIFSNAGTGITTYGILECDVLWVPGGQLLFYPPGYIIFTQYAHLSNGASLHSFTTMNAGPWFNCISKGSGIDEGETFQINLYPNPAGNLLNISGCELFDEYVISDMSGHVLQNGELIKNTLDISTLANGYYILSLKNKGNVCKKKFIKNS